MSNTFRVRRSIFGTGRKYSARYSVDNLRQENKEDVLPVNTKILCWTIFLIIFIENGTLGLLPRQAYFIYRNVRISDLLIYGLVIYSLFNVKEFYELYRSKPLLIVKILFLYFLFEFLVSAFLYEFNIVEYFFRLKGLWSSFIIFPFLLLVKRNGLAYLFRIIFPVAIVSNILYILSALTGIAFLPDIGIAKQYLEGGLKVYRVFGGTFYGEFFFLGYIYYWITGRFRLYQLFLVIFFIIPHILAFGRAAWLYFIFTIILMLGWNALKKRGFRILFRQTILISVLSAALIYAFIRFVPGSDYLTEALGKRVIQGQEDVTYEKGTYGSRLNQNETLLELWMNSNILMGIGMHPMWVYRPETTEEVRYYSGFSDVRWTAVLAAYGLIGFTLAIIFQIYYIITTFKLLKRTQVSDILTFFLLLMMSQLLFDTLISYNFALISINQFGLSFHFALYTAVVVYKYQQLFE